jgi:hypothetical protein
VEVLVGFMANECDGCCDAEDVPLERQTGQWERVWCGPGDEVGDGDVLDRQQARPILQRLHRPPLDTACQQSVKHIGVS